VPARRSTGIGTQRKQRAFGLVLFLVILVLGVLGALLSRFSPATQRIERDKVTERVLAEAKAALIGYAARDPNRPGSLPCPDPKAVPDGRPSIADGDANPFNNPPFNCTDTSSTRIGRLPWRTLGLPEPRDGRGELLWYVVSRDFRANDTSALNSDVQGSLETRTAGGAVAASNLVALIIAPGSPVGNQSRPGNDPAQYVEFQNPSPPATGTPPVYPYQLLSGSNDSILPVSHRDLFTVVDQAVFSRIEETFVPKMQALAAQWGRYPFAMPFHPATLGARGETGTYEGSLPFAYASVSQAFWLGPSASWVGGAGTLNSQTCTVGPGSGLLNDKWMKCQVTHTGQITFRISVVARRGGRSFLDVSWDSTSSLSGASWSGALWGSPSASSATVRFTATTPNTTGTFTVRLRLELAKLVGIVEERGGRLDALKANLEDRPGHEASIEAVSELLSSKGQHRQLADLLEQQAQRLETAGEISRAAKLWARYAHVAEVDTKEVERAIGGHRRVVALAPTSESLRALARLNLERSQPGQAVPWLESLLGTVAPAERLLVISQLAKAHLSANQPDRAIAAIEVNLDDKEPAIELRTLLSDLYRKAEMWEPLARHLTRSLPLLKDDNKLARDFAREASSIYLTRLGSPAKAIPALETALQLDPTDKDLRTALAIGQRVAGKLVEARTALTELISDFGRRRSPERAALHVELARVAQAEGKLDEAMTEMEAASKMDVSNAAIQKELAEMARTAGQLDKAERTYRALLLVVRRTPAGDDEAAVGASEVLFELHKLAASRNVVAVVDCGVAPGLSNMILGHCEATWDAVESFSCWVGGLPVVRHWPYEYRSVFSPIDVIAEYNRPARLVANGRVVTRPALSELELLDLPGVGTLEAFNTDGLRTLLRTSTVPTMKEKTMRYPGHAEMMRMLRDSGFFGEQPLEVAGVRLRPLDLTARLLSDAWQPSEGEEDITVMRVEVEGTVGGAAVRHRWDLVDHYDRGRGVSSMARTTGYTCTAAVHALAAGLHRRPGVVPPEDLGRNQACFDAVIAYLAARGVVLRHSVEEAS